MYDIFFNMLIIFDGWVLGEDDTSWIIASG